ncbi:MAG TPA: hypothetical protein VK021_12200, partial [Flavobacteriaceae bacterium]|nr:hypothetical protein [Flavobacteriaceae bacterium]
MQVKKNPKADVGKRSLLFFQIGLVIMLSVSWVALEWKTYDKKADYGQLDLGDDLMEEVPVTQDLNIPPPPPPPPPPPAPDIVDVIEDESEEEETIIESTETTPETKIVEVTQIVEEVIEEEIEEVPFAVIENVPVYPGCENERTNDAKRKCMSDKVNVFIQRRFNTDLAGDLGLQGIQRIMVQFKIDPQGRVTEV